MTSPTGAPADLPTDSRVPLRWGLFFIVFGFGGFMVWSFLMPIDSGVPANGSVVHDGRRKSVQHSSGGVIKQILVKEGDSVKEGTLLIRMDDTAALANKSAAQAEVQALKAQIDYLEKLTTGLSPLVKQELYPAAQFLELEKQRAEAVSRLRAQFDRLVAADLEVRRNLIFAPSAGRVMGLVVTTEGGVVPPGGRLLDIVPDEDKLVIEAQIEPHLIDKVVPGLITEVRFSAFNLRSTPVIEGKIEWVSADRFQNPQDSSTGGAGFYTSRIIVSNEELKKVQELKIRAGMPVEVIIRTGERTFFEYLLKPLTDRVAGSLRER